jgi:hypothetical protein
MAVERFHRPSCSYTFLHSPHYTRYIHHMHYMHYKHGLITLY